MILGCDDYSSQNAQYDADVVVIGTGAGGAVAGCELAEAGLKVIFLEEGSHHPTATFSTSLTTSATRLYRDAGAAMLLGNPPIAVLEGRCVGGSTVVNGGMIYRAPERILDGWARNLGDPTLGPQGMDEAYQRVEERINVAQPLAESVGDDSRLMALGARRLGWKFTINPRNQKQCVGANNCVMGCPTGAKQSTLVSYMPRALAAGANCLTDVRATSLLIENGRCVGVEGRVYDPRTRRKKIKIAVHARAVVVSCGAIQTPHLLQGHRRLRRNRQLGKNLYVHPHLKVLALYPFDVRAWQGVNQFGQIKEFEDQGIVMAENFVHPGVVAGRLPEHGARAWELMNRYNQMVLSGGLVEDSHSGSVRRGPFDMALGRYQINDEDHRRFLFVTRKLCELHFEAGADLLVLPFSNAPYAENMEQADAALAKQTRFDTLELVAVHLMGTARIGEQARDSVANLHGELWDLPGCFVADGSVFPTPIGVNPQLTIMALATRIGQRLAESLARKPLARAG